MFARAGSAVALALLASSSTTPTLVHAQLDGLGLIDDACLMGLGGPECEEEVGINFVQKNKDLLLQHELDYAQEGEEYLAEAKEASKKASLYSHKAEVLLNLQEVDSKLAAEQKKEQKDEADVKVEAEPSAQVSQDDETPEANADAKAAAEEERVLDKQLSSLAESTASV
eukprot:TRINITY_DN24367_c0_g3_i1.p1 TRINITY_DN24367_c0_g3~~TRINITY_DN24367_c0_g3_i1.p1  ORF type:complete len:197 (-),score=67.67 TRINITY_DN24367_c0_g3_i1:188-697(-)